MAHWWSQTTKSCSPFYIKGSCIWWIGNNLLIQVLIKLYISHLKVFQMCINVLKDQQMHFGFMDVILFQHGHQHGLATHVAIFRVVRSRTQMYIKCV
jgi:hypothetical protein